MGRRGNDNNENEARRENLNGIESEKYENVSESKAKWQEGRA